MSISTRLPLAWLQRVVLIAGVVLQLCCFQIALSRRFGRPRQHKTEPLAASSLHASSSQHRSDSPNGRAIRDFLHQSPNFIMSTEKMSASMEPTPVAPPVSEVGETESLKHDARQTDLAATYLNNAEHHEPLSPEAEKRFKRRTDWILLPMVCHVLGQLGT